MSAYPPDTWFRPGLAVRPGAIQGRGLFTAEPIRAGEVVLVWGGAPYSRADLEGGRVPRGISYSFIDEDVLLAGPADGMDYFVNHSCDPNVWMRDEVTVIAARDIAAGEEIAGDYALWESDPAFALDPCACGTRLCRGRVTGDDWRRPDLQRRYAGRFLPYLQRRIDRSRA